MNKPLIITKVSIIFFYDGDGNILLQDRKEISKHGEEYGFFGGKIEKGETPEQALKREIMEELGTEITDYEFFRKYHYINNETNRDVTRYVYIAKMPDLKSLNVMEGKLAFMKVEDSYGLKMMYGYRRLIDDIVDYLQSKGEI